MMDKKVKVFVLARDANGAPDIVDYDITCTQAQYDNGDHYELATERAEEDGYETPMEAFDENDPAGRRLLAVPKVIVNLSGGLIESVEADGPVSVTCLDADTEGGDEDRIVEVDGREVYVSEFEINAGESTPDAVNNTLEQVESGLAVHAARKNKSIPKG